MNARVLMTREQFAAFCPAELIDAWFDPINSAMDAADITTPNRARMFLATAAHESGRFRFLVESLNYSSAQLLQNWPNRFSPLTAVAFAHKPAEIANFVYSNREGNGPPESGDGWKFRGRGFGITFRNNYSWISAEMCGDSRQLLQNPDLMIDPDYAAHAFALYWGRRDLNILADAGNFDGVSDVFNRGKQTAAIGDSIGWRDRLALFNNSERAFHVA